MTLEAREPGYIPQLVDAIVREGRQPSTTTLVAMCIRDGATEALGLLIDGEVDKFYVNHPHARRQKIDGTVLRRAFLSAYGVSKKRTKLLDGSALLSDQLKAYYATPQKAIDRAKELGAEGLKPFSDEEIAGLFA